MRILILSLLVACAAEETTASREQSAGDDEAMAIRTGPEVAAELDAPPGEREVVVEPPTETAESAVANESGEDPPESTPVTRRPTTILAPARSGQISMTAVREVIRNHQEEVGACYREGLDRNRALAGEVRVRFLIGPSGRVDSAEAYESTLGDAAVESCIVSAMLDWRFPRPRPRRSSVLLTYPYVLATE